MRISSSVAQDPHAALTSAQGYEAMHAEDWLLRGFPRDELALLLDIVGENCCSVGRLSACLVAPQRDPPFAQKARLPRVCWFAVPALALHAGCLRAGKEVNGARLR